jgi:hypothetical protein
MAELVDFNAACAAFAQSHDRGQDLPIAFGMDACPHFGPWAQQLLPAGHLTDEDRAYQALRTASPDSQLATALVLLERAGVSSSWIGVIEGIAVCDERKPAEWAAVYALYGLVAEYLSRPLHSREDAVALAHLVEATTLFESWVIKDTDSYNYIPMGFVQGWWPAYLEAIDAWVTPADLLALSQAEGGVSETEAQSSVTPPDRLAEIYAASPSVGAGVNPNLPDSFVNAAMAGDLDLLFHPNADPEKSWAVISGLLESGDGEDLAVTMREFENMRDDSWSSFWGYGINGPHATLLRGRIASWCAENINDEDERLELLEMLGIDAEIDAEEDE